MAKKTAKKTTKKTAKKTRKKKTSRKKSTTSSRPKKATRPSTVNVTTAPVTTQEGCAWCKNELEDEHIVLSHLMYILFLAATGFAAIFTIFLFTQNQTQDYNGIKALVLIAWAFLFKTFGHRIHVPHH